MPFCGHCKNLGKEYTSHFPHKTQSKNSQLTCPELLKSVCTKCSSRNHTFDKCNKTQSVVSTPVVETPVNKSSTSKYNILDDEQCPICQCVTCYCDNDYLETKSRSLRDYGEELYAIVAKDYPYCAGKITGMFLELDQSEITELLETPALLKAKTKEANDLIDAKYPWGHIDAIFIPPSVHSRSSACETNLEEVEKMDVREEYRARVYATNPFLNCSLIDKIVEHFVTRALEPEEMYELFVNFEEFKKQVILAKSHIEKYEEFSRSPTFSASAGAYDEDDYAEFSASDRFQDEDDYSEFSFSDRFQDED